MEKGRAIRAPGAGQLLVRTTFMPVDPYMRGRMSDAPSLRLAEGPVSTLG